MRIAVRLIRQPGRRIAGLSKLRSAMLSATLMPAMQALCKGSSGRLNTFCCNISVRVARYGTPLTLILPLRNRRCPNSASISSFCPFPEIPATPTISPRLTFNDNSFTAVVPRSLATQSRNISRPIGASSFTGERIFGAAAMRASPIIHLASSSGLVCSTFVWPTNFPLRSTVTSSANDMTSLNLCVIINTVNSERCARSRTRPSTSSDSCGVNTDVGSSNIRKRCLR